MIKKENLKYKCNFCGKMFDKCSSCAKHIERKCYSGMVFPSDILMVDKTIVGEEE